MRSWHLFTHDIANAPVNWNPHPPGPGEGWGKIGASNHFWTTSCPLGVVHLTVFDRGSRPHLGQEWNWALVLHMELPRWRKAKERYVTVVWIHAYHAFTLPSTAIDIQSESSNLFSIVWMYYLHLISIEIQMVCMGNDAERSGHELFSSLISYRFYFNTKKAVRFLTFIKMKMLL